MEKTVENSTNMAEDPTDSSPAGLSPQGGSRLSPPAKTDEGEVTSQTSQPSPGQGMEEALIEMIEQEVSKRFQSAKDKRWAQLEKQYGDLSELREMVAELLEKNPAPPCRTQRRNQPGRPRGRVGQIPWFENTRHRPRHAFSPRCAARPDQLHTAAGRPADDHPRGKGRQPAEPGDPRHSRNTRREQRSRGFVAGLPAAQTPTASGGCERPDRPETRVSQQGVECFLTSGTFQKQIKKL